MLVIPEAMAPYRHFLIWTAEPSRTRPGKTDKFPIHPLTRRVSGINDPAILMSGAEAQTYLAAGVGSGVGFVFTKADPFFFFDIDSCLTDAGQWSLFAQQMCASFAGCFIEVSQSGRGLHIIGSAAAGPHRCKPPQGSPEMDIELYTEDRFCALTGTGAMGSPAHIAQAQIDWLIARHFPPAPELQSSEWTDEPCAEWNGPTDDQSLVAKMLGASGSVASMFGARATFRELWEADEDALSRHYPDAARDFDHNRADAALIQHLAFWTGKDCERMDRLFRLSGLNRGKWEDRQKYREDTILKAVSICQQVYGRASAKEGHAAAMPTEPLPLLRTTQKNYPFPKEALPPVIQEAVARVCEVVQAPLDLVCQSFLAAATLATQPLVDVLIDGRRFPVSNNYIALGISGERKSAVDRLATGPIKNRQHEMTQAFHANQRQFEAENAAWENQRKEAMREKDVTVIEAMLRHAGEMPKHLQPCHVVSEPTFQAIEKCFAEGRYTLGLFSDEGGKFLGGYAMAKENQTNTLTGLSKLWDGDPLDRLRVGDGKSSALSILYGRRFSVHLMIQPVLASQLFGNRMMSGQGFLSRCLCCWPASTIGTRPYKAVDLSKDKAIQDYNAAMKAILDVPQPMNEREEMGLSPRSLTLSTEATSTWIDFHNRVEERQRPGGDLSPITGFASKTAEHAARIAGVLTAFKNPNATEIGVDPIRGGVAIAEYYMGEALRLFHTSTDDTLLTLAEECFSYGMEKTTGVIGLRNLYQSGPNAVRSRAQAANIMQILEDHSRAVKLPGGTIVDGKHNRDAWQLIPLEG